MSHVRYGHAQYIITNLVPYYRYAAIPSEAAGQKIDSCSTTGSAMARAQAERTSRGGTPSGAGTPRAVSPTGTGSPPLSSKFSYRSLNDPSSTDKHDPPPFSLNAPPPAASSAQAAALSSSPPSSSMRPKIRGRGSRRSSKAVPSAADRATEASPGPSRHKLTIRDKDRDRDKDKGGDGHGDSTSPKEKKSGFLGILSSKKGRDKSPRRENGVLGKEGARVIISGG